MRISNWLLAVMPAVMLAACGPSPVPDLPTPTAAPTPTAWPSPTPTPTPAQPPQLTPASMTSSSGYRWELVWSDEFDYAGPPDPARWGYEAGYLRNDELQYYRPSRLENARVEDGMLVLEARKEPYKGYGYTSASLTTQGRAAWTYGRIEVRAKLPTGRGMWPAIWMLGSDIATAGWPNCGEMDIMENVGFDPNRIHTSIHTKAYNHARGTQRTTSVVVSPPYEDFHVYALEWFPERLAFWIDDERVLTFDNEGTGWAVWPYDGPFYLILNIAVGGSWGGQYGVDDTIFPQRFWIDYVRVYQQAGGPGA